MDPTLNNTNFSQENRIMGYFSYNGKLYINESEQSELYGFCIDGENWKDYSSRPYDKQKPKTKNQKTNKKTTCQTVCKSTTFFAPIRQLRL